MISGVGGAVVVASDCRLHYPSHGGRKFFPASAIPWRSLCARCAVPDNARLQPCNAHSLARETVAPGSEFTQQQHLVLKKEGGVEVSRASDCSLSGKAMAGIPFGGRQLLGEIADVGGTTAEDAVVQRNVGGSDGVEAAVQSEDAGLSSKGGESGSGFRFEIVIKGINDVKKQAEMLKEEVTSFDYNVSPTTYSPVEGFEAYRFAGICAVLFFVYWLGNYYVPDLIFKDTVFRKKPEDPVDTTFEDKELAGSNQQSPEGSADASENSVANAERSTSRKGGTGFGQSKQKRLKSAKRK